MTIVYYLIPQEYSRPGNLTVFYVKINIIVISFSTLEMYEQGLYYQQNLFFRISIFLNNGFKQICLKSFVYNIYDYFRKEREHWYSRDYNWLVINSGLLWQIIRMAFPWTCKIFGNLSVRGVWDAIDSSRRYISNADNL